MVHANVLVDKRNTEAHDIAEEIEEVEEENKSLKVELKKNQEALSLLLGAVRSNGKMDKYRVQAERILHGMEESRGRAGEQRGKEEEKTVMLPKITMRHQSIMHDYLLAAARRTRKGR